MGGETAVAYVAVGSNIEPERHLPAALEELCREAPVDACSTFYRTVPLARPEQPPFANGVWRLRTGLAPRELKFAVLRGVEARLGRRRGGDPHAARTVDLDLVLHGEAVIDEPDLRLPDPQIWARPFVAVPLAELAPGLVLPGGRPLAEVAGELAGAAALEPWPELTRKLQRRLTR